jgi:hypothetical protein
MAKAAIPVNMLTMVTIPQRLYTELPMEAKAIKTNPPTDNSVKMISHWTMPETSLQLK